MGKRKSLTLADGAYTKPIKDKIGVLYFNNKKIKPESLQPLITTVKNANIFEYFIVMPDDVVIKTFTKEQLFELRENLNKFIKSLEEGDNVE